VVSVNVPNALTLLRIFLVPLLVVILLTRMPAKEYLALVIFLLAALTDALDGYLARKYKKVTTLGILLDPIADKLLVSAALISLVDLQEADAWAVCIIIGREFAVSGLRSIAAAHGIIIPASKLGKWKMATQVTGISLMILGSRLDDIGLWRNTGKAALWVMTAVALVSGFDYFRRYLKELLLIERGALPAPSPAHPAKDGLEDGAA
jgi:CDP-diacylglycerol--glycerol-3-phosphate 3-phosphatidyltransferase